MTGAGVHAPITEAPDPAADTQAEEEDSMEGSHTVSLSSAAATRRNAARTITHCMQTTQCVS